MEKAYEFRNRLLQIHKKDIRDPKRIPEKNEFFLPDQVLISIAGNAGEVVRTAAQDFQSFLRDSMGIIGVVYPGKCDAHITAVLDADLGEYATYRGFRIDTDAEGIRISGYDERGIAQAFFFLEIQMEFAKSPAVAFTGMKSLEQRTAQQGLL